MAKEITRKGGSIMGKPIQRKRYKYKGAINNCEICNECEYIGEGDFACMKYDYPAIVKEDWTPTEYYNNCKKCRNYIPNIKE